MTKEMVLNELGESQLMEMETILDKDLPDNKEAVRAVAQAIRRELALWRDSPRPLGRFLVAGPISQATKLAAGLSHHFFGDDCNAVIQLDMQNYAEKHQIPRLIGHNGGVVCAYVEGELTEPVRRGVLRF